MISSDDLNSLMGKQLVTIPAPRDVAEETYEVIFEIIKQFESKVPNTHIPCANFTVRPFRVALAKVSYFAPDILVFYGRSLSDGAPVHIVQHICQLTLSLIAEPLPDNLERRPIGFSVWGQESTQG